MARPREKQLRVELDQALSELHDLPQAKTARASLDHAALMLKVWSLRFQLANIAYDKAVASDESEVGPRNAMREASTQLNEWEKRKSAAQADLVNDLLLAEQEHNAKQDSAEDRFAEMKAKRDADRRSVS